MSAIPLQRSKKLLEEDGWKVWKVEVWNQWAHKRIDLYHMMDLVAIKATVNGVLGIQCCGEDVSAHLQKLEASEYYPIWKAAGNGLVIHGWVKRGGRGERKTWQLREVIL